MTKQQNPDADYGHCFRRRDLCAQIETKLCDAKCKRSLSCLGPLLRNQFMPFVVIDNFTTLSSRLRRRNTRARQFAVHRGQNQEYKRYRFSTSRNIDIAAQSIPWPQTDRASQAGPNNRREKRKGRNPSTDRLTFQFGQPGFSRRTTAAAFRSKKLQQMRLLRSAFERLTVASPANRVAMPRTTDRK